MIRVSDDHSHLVPSRAQVREHIGGCPRVHFQSLNVLKDYLATYWTGTTMPPSAEQQMSALLRNRPGAGIVVPEVFRFNVLRKA